MIDPNRLYYSAHEEEKVINKYIDKNPDTEIGTYIDIGAGDPIENSNTYYYYVRGWRGILVEPYPSCLIYIPRDRPEDIFESIVISDYDGTIEMCDSAAVDTFLGKEYKRRWPERVRTNQCLTLNSLIKKYPNYASPDFINLDVETHEEKVLSQTDFSIFKPKVMLIECLCRDKNYRQNWEHYVLPYYDYKEMIGANAVYVRRSI